MNISKEAVMYGIIGLLTGIVVTTTIAATAANNHNDGMMKMMGMHTDGNGHSNMQNMNNTDMTGKDGVGM